MNMHGKENDRTMKKYEYKNGLLRVPVRRGAGGNGCVFQNAVLEGSADGSADGAAQMRSRISCANFLASSLGS